MINLTIDGQQVSVPEGTTILDAARKLKLDIPTLCYLNLEKIRYLNKVASCRICVVEVEGRRNLAPSCATPVSEGMKVHKKDCPNAISMQSNYAYRIKPAKWIDSSQQEFTAVISLTGIDNLGLVNSVTRVISGNMHVNMKSINFDTDDGIFSGKIKLVVKNNTILKRLMNNLKKINGIDKVVRM